MTFLAIVLLMWAAVVLFVVGFGFSKILLYCYIVICRTSRSKDEDVDSLDEVVVDHRHQERKNPRVLISDIAVMKHILPSCQTDKEAEIFSRRRNILSEAEANTVIKAQEWDFHLDLTGTFIRSNNPVPYWQCEKLDNGEFKVSLLNSWVSCKYNVYSI